MGTAVDMQLRLKALPLHPQTLPPAESIRQERKCGQQRQSVAVLGTRVPCWNGGWAGLEVFAKEKKLFVSRQGRNR